MYSAFYMQVVSIGLVWVFFHCGGMCGPIVAGLTSARPVEGSRLKQLRTRAGRVLAYQFGRALTYALLGAFAGLMGMAFEESIRGFAQVAGLVLAFVMVGIGLMRIGPLKRHAPAWVQNASRTSGEFLGTLLRAARRKGPSKGLAGFAFTGIVLGLLPCMLMFWVLSIATSTASVLHGAGVMVLLVAMTTPTLLAAGCAPQILGRRVNSEAVVSFALILSGVWMFMMAAAANGWIDHIHFQFELFDESYVLMLW